DRNSLRVESQHMTLHRHRFELRGCQSARQRYGDVIAFKWNRPVQQLARVIANLEQISPWAEHRMLAKFVPDFRYGQGRDLLLHERLHATYPVFQRFVDGVVQTGAHGEPCRNAESRDTAGKNEEIPCGQSKADRSRFQTASSSRNVYPIPRTVWSNLDVP